MEIKMKKTTIIKINKKLQKVKELNKVLSKKINKQKKQAEDDHDQVDFLKCEILKLNPSYKFDNSGKFKKKMKIRKRDKFLCCFCRKNILDVSQDSTLHHKVPRRYGGKDNPKNLITICYDCHKLLEELITLVENKAIKYAKEQDGGKNEI